MARLGWRNFEVIDASGFHLTTCLLLFCRPVLLLVPFSGDVVKTPESETETLSRLEVSRPKKKSVTMKWT